MMSVAKDRERVAGHSVDDVIRWLIEDTGNESFLEDVFANMCANLRQVGIPLKRASLHLLIRHPQWLGAGIEWADGEASVKFQHVDYDVRDRADFIGSPVYEIQEGANEVRENLERDPSVGRRHFLYEELRSKGFTEYIAWPLFYTPKQQHVVTFSTNRAGGFSDEHVRALSKVLPSFALVSEVRLKTRLASRLLQTYVGPHASELILAGATRRGSGTTVHAAIMICDLRDFTRISEKWPRDDVIDLLNQYFDAMSEPIQRHGGEILKFIGDGLLAIFPLDKPTACADLLRATAEAHHSLASINSSNLATGRAPLHYGIGAHVGDVMYGNIGSRSRLDFTVIGPAVNMASRLESLTKQLGKTVLVSREFADLVPAECKLEKIGEQRLRGFSDAVEIFAFNVE
jgi:adenylate cyclase